MQAVISSRWGGLSSGSAKENRVAHSEEWRALGSFENNGANPCIAWSLWSKTLHDRSRAQTAKAQSETNGESLTVITPR